MRPAHLHWREACANIIWTDPRRSRDRHRKSASQIWVDGLVEVPDGPVHILKRHKEGCAMVKSRWLAIPGALVLCFGTVWVTNAQAPAQGPSVAVYCRGPLSTFRTEGGKVIRTPFKWSKEAATKENPGAGECAWADGPPQGIESKPGESSAIVGNLGPF